MRRFGGKTGRLDANQALIMRDLKKCGVSVEPLNTLGGGIPDLLCGYQGANYLLEVKDSSQPPSKKKLTEDEVNWHENWHGQKCVVETLEEALKACNCTKQQ